MEAWLVSLTAGGLALVLTTAAGLLHGVALATVLARAGLFAVTSGVAGFGLWLLWQNYFQHNVVSGLNKVGQNVDIKIDDRHVTGYGDDTVRRDVGTAQQGAGTKPRR